MGGWRGRARRGCLECGWLRGAAGRLRCAGGGGRWGQQRRELGGREGNGWVGGNAMGMPPPPPPPMRMQESRRCDRSVTCHSLVTSHKKSAAECMSAKSLEVHSGNGFFRRGGSPECNGGGDLFFAPREGLSLRGAHARCAMLRNSAWKRELTTMLRCRDEVRELPKPGPISHCHHRHQIRYHHPDFWAAVTVTSAVITITRGAMVITFTGLNIMGPCQVGRHALPTAGDDVTAATSVDQTAF